MGKRLTVLPWSCHKTGDCCRNVERVVMTREEAALVYDAAGTKAPDLTWAQVDGPFGKFVALLARPCPLLVQSGPHYLCSIYESRPYNCRRFGCLRPDPTTEPLELDNGDLGCANLRDRVYATRDARRWYIRFQNKAQRWATKHGWKI